MDSSTSRSGKPTPARGVSVNEARQLANRRVRRVSSRPPEAKPDGQVYAFTPVGSPDRLPRKVKRCRAARHAIAEELFAALRGEQAPWVLADHGRRPGALMAIAAASAAVLRDPVEHFKQSWLHAAGRAAREGFRFETAPHPGTKRAAPWAHILCDHDACRTHTCNAVAIIVTGEYPLLGLKQSGLVRGLDPVERCAHRRRTLLGEMLPELSGDGRFVAPAKNAVPDRLTMDIADDGTWVALECSHPGCRAADKHQIGMSWHETVPAMAAGQQAGLSVIAGSL